MVGRPAWQGGSAANLPLSSCLTSWGVSRHLTINLQDSGIFLGSFLSPFLLHGPRKSGPRKPERPEGLTHLSSLCPSPTPRHHLAFACWVCHTFPAPTVSCPRFSGSWVRWGLGPGCGGQNPGWRAMWAWPSLLPSSELGRPPQAWIWSEAGTEVFGPIPPPSLPWDLQNLLRVHGPWEDRNSCSGPSDGAGQLQREWVGRARRGSNLPGGPGMADK